MLAARKAPHPHADAGVDADSIQSNIVNIAVAAVMGVVAFTD